MKTGSVRDLLYLESLERRRLLSFSWEGTWYFCGGEFSNADDGVVTELKAGPVIYPFTLTDGPGDQYELSMTGNGWDLAIPFVENGGRLEFEQSGYDHGYYESGAGQLFEITDGVIGFIGGIGRYSNSTLCDLIYSDALVGVATREPFNPHMLPWEGEYDLEDHCLVMEPGHEAYLESVQTFQAELVNEGNGTYYGHAIDVPDDGGHFSLDGISLYQHDVSQNQYGEYCDQQEWLMRGPEELCFGIGTQYRYNDAGMTDFDNSDYWLTVIERTDPIAEGAGVTGVRVARDVDYDYPGSGDDGYGCVAEIYGREITRWTVSVPWGETYDSVSDHGAVWDGSDFYEYGYLELMAQTDDDGGQYIQVDWESVGVGQWNQLDSEPITVTVYYEGGNWSKDVYVTDVTVPSGGPVLTYPSHHQTNVPTNATIQWQSWVGVEPNDAINVVVDDFSDNNVYQGLLSGVNTSLCLPENTLSANTDYEIETSFVDIVELPNDDGVTVFVMGLAESDYQFCTGSGGPVPIGIADLMVELGDMKSPDILVPGDKLKVPILVRNGGSGVAEGEMDITLYASMDPYLDGGDILVTSLESQKVKLKVGQVKKYNVQMVIPDDVPEGSYYLIVEADSGHEIVESDESNNVVCTEESGTIGYYAGSFGGRKNVKLAASDGQGEEFTLSLSGDGYVDLSWHNGLPELTLYGTTEGSSLTIKSKGEVDFGRIMSGGSGVVSLGKLNGKLVNLAADVDLIGSLGSLQVNDILDGVDVSTSVGYSKGTAVKANKIGAVDFDITGDVKSLQAGRYLDGLLKADNIFKVDIKAGDLGANVSAVDVIKQVSVKKGDFTGHLRAGFLGKLQAQNIVEAVVSTVEGIGQVKANDIIDTFLLAGYDIGLDCQMNTGDEAFHMNTADIAKLETGSQGRFDGSYALAGVRPFLDDFSQIIATDSSQQVISRGSIKSAKLGQVYIGDTAEGVYGLYAATEIGKVTRTEVAALGLPDYQEMDIWI